MGRRKTILANGCYYHVFNRSIAGFEIFREDGGSQRMLEVLRFYRTALKGLCFSHALSLGKTCDPEKHGPARIRILAYCLMPTHFHLFLEQLTAHGISDCMRCVEQGYSTYFNLRHRRKGPLWESKFKSVMVTDDAHAQHLARYIHLNPTSAGLTQRPEDWEFSSYREHLGAARGESLCEFRKLLGMTPEDVRRFTENRIDYQKSLQEIKYLLLD